MLLIGQQGYESLLAEEAEQAGGLVAEKGPGWVRTEPWSSPTVEWAFPHVALRSPTEIVGESVNALAQRLVDFLLKSLQGERIDAPWPCVFAGPAEMVGLGRRIGAVEKAFHDALKKRLSRVARLATADAPRGVVPCSRGLWVWFADFGRLWVSREAMVNGQRRMSDDEAAPSRSYLKVEEAYVVLGHEPVAGETVVDLGAAPGGWSYSAAKRGAQVLALDNGPLKGGALGHPQIEHRCEDAFKFQPAAGVVYDWLFCDMVDDPHHVLQHIVELWLARGWCRNFVINLKFGRVDPAAFLRELRAPSSPFVAYGEAVRVRHLYHDREEFTVVGRVRTAV